jgi:hypothetical protein
MAPTPLTICYKTGPGFRPGTTRQVDLATMVNVACDLSAFRRPVAGPAADRLGAYTQLGEPALPACHPALRPSASRCWAAPTSKEEEPSSANSRREAVMNRPPGPQLWHEVSRQESTAYPLPDIDRGRPAGSDGVGPQRDVGNSERGRRGAHGSRVVQSLLNFIGLAQCSAIRQWMTPRRRNGAQRDPEGIDPQILPARGRRVILDRDLASLYGVAIRAG